MPTSWDDLPYDVKFLIFQNLPARERFKFAKCSTGVAMDVYEFERDWTEIIFQEAENGYEIHLGVPWYREPPGAGCEYIHDYVKIDFKKVENNCEVFWLLENETFWKKVVKSDNIEKVALEFFESMLSKFQKSFIKLHMIHIDYTLNIKSINTFPELKKLKIVTNNYSNIYWLLSKSPVLTELKITFYQSSFFNEKQLTRLIESNTFKLENLENLEIDTDFKLIAEDVLSRSESLRNFKFSFDYDDTPESNEKIVRILKSSKIKKLEFFSCLNDALFSDLVLSGIDVKCRGELISHDCIYSLCRPSHRNPNRERVFSIGQVDESILDAECYDWKSYDDGYFSQPTNCFGYECIGEIFYYKYDRLLTCSMRRRY